MKAHLILNTPKNLQWCKENLTALDYAVTGEKILLKYYEDHQINDILNALRGNDSKEEVVIYAFAPTIHQKDSLYRLGMPIRSHGNGSFTSEMVFENRDAAKKHLHGVAHRYYEDGFELLDAAEQIEKGYLEIGFTKAEIKIINE